MQLLGYVKSALAVIGVFATLNFCNDVAGTVYIRQHQNAISNLEKEWSACRTATQTDPDLRREIDADAGAREQCRNDAFARHQRAKDSLMAACGISQVGNFLSYRESSGGGDVARTPSYYDIPWGLWLSSACKMLLDDPNGGVPA